MKSVYSNWKTNDEVDEFEEPTSYVQIPSMPYRRKSVVDSKKEELLSQVRHSVIGNTYFLSPFQRRQKITYCDHTRRSLCLTFIESWMNKHVKPYFTSGVLGTATGLQTRMLREESRQFLLNFCSCNVHNEILLFCRNGAVGALRKLLHIMNINPRQSRNRRTSEGGHQFVVFIGPHDPLSTLLAFQRKGFFVIQIPENRYGMADLNILEEYLQQHSINGGNKDEQSEDLDETLRTSPKRRKSKSKKKVLIGCFATCSPINGMVMNHISITQLLHKYGAISIFDYSVGSSVMRIEMNSVISEDETVSKDVIFFSTGNFLGSPDGSGILIIKKRLLSSHNPFWPSSRSIHFFKDPPRIRSRTDPTDFGIQLPSIFEDNQSSLGGKKKYQRSRTTPNEDEDGMEINFLELRGFRNSNHSIYNSDAFSLYEGNPHLGDVTAFLSYRLKVAIGEVWTWQASNRWSQVIRKRLSDLPNIVLLGGDFGTHVTLISFLIRYDKKYYLHHRFIVALLNDLFGIQCGCTDRGITKYQYLQILGTEIETFRKLNEFLNRKVRYEKEFGSDEVQGMQGYSILRPGWVTFTLLPHMAGPTYEYVIQALEFVAREGWKFLVEYRVDDEGEFLHKGSNQRSGWKMLRDFDDIIKKPSQYFTNVNSEENNLDEEFADDEFNDFMNENLGSYEEQVILNGIGGRKRFSVHNMGAKKKRQGERRRGRQIRNSNNSNNISKRRKKKQRNRINDEELWKIYEKSLQFAEQTRKVVEEGVIGRDEGDENHMMLSELEYESEIVGEEVESYRWFVLPREVFTKLRTFDPIGFYDDVKKKKEEKKKKMMNIVDEEEKNNNEEEKCWIQPRVYESARNSPLMTFHPPTVDTSPPSAKIGTTEPLVSSFPKKTSKKKKYYHHYNRRKSNISTNNDHSLENNRKRKSINQQYSSEVTNNNLPRKSVEENQNEAKRRRSVMEMQIRRMEEEKAHDNKYFNFRRKSKVVIPTGITLHIENNGDSSVVISNNIEKERVESSFEDDGHIVFSDNNRRRGSRVVLNEENEIELIEEEEKQHQQNPYNNNNYRTPQLHKRSNNNNRRGSGRVYGYRKANSEHVNRLGVRRRRKERSINRTKNINVSGFYSNRRNKFPNNGHQSKYSHVQKRYVPSLNTVGTRLRGSDGGYAARRKKYKRGGGVYVRKLEF